MAEAVHDPAGIIHNRDSRTRHIDLDIHVVWSATYNVPKLMFQAMDTSELISDLVTNKNMEEYLPELIVESFTPFRYSLSGFHHSWLTTHDRRNDEAWNLAPSFRSKILTTTAARFE